MPAYSSLAIANEFIRRADRDGRVPLTHMQLQKLVYLAHGWHLAFANDPLIEDEIEAWELGPVIRRLYDALKQYGRSRISKLIDWGDDTPFDLDMGGPALEELDESKQRIIELVWQNYGEFPAFQLSALTHQEGTPWSKHYERNKNNTIPNDDIKAHFSELAAA